MKQQIFLILLLSLFCLGGCVPASSNKTLYNEEGLNRINSWEIVFAYETGEIEQTVTNEGESAARVMKSGQSANDIQLRDDIFFYLKDKFKIAVSREPAHADGQIRFHPVHFGFGGFKSLDVSFYTKTNELLARTKIMNGYQNATFKDDDDFAVFAGDAIGEILKSR